MSVFSYFSLQALLTHCSQTLTTTATTTSTTATTTATAKTATTATTTAALQQGPVGQPASTTGTPGGPTPYTYTTVVNGQTTVLTDVFTPTSPSTINVTAGASGTILGYSSWLSIYGSGATAAASAGHSTVPFTWGTFFIAMIPFAFL